MNGARVRIVVVGAGLIGRRHIDLVRAGTRCELAAIVDPAPAAGELAARLDVPWSPSLTDLLAEPLAERTGVIVATPNRLHVGHGLACIAAGVPVLVEKPLADSVADGVRLVEAAEAAAVPLLVGHHRRHSPLVESARRLVHDGTLGRLVAVQGSALFHKPDEYYDAAPWRREPGGGPLLINLVHEVDVMRAICGDVVAVQAMAASTIRGFPVEDTAAVSLLFANGAMGSFLLSDAAASPRSWEQTSREDPRYPTHPDEDCYLVAGTTGSVEVPTMRLRTYAGTRSWEEPFESTIVDVPRDDPLVRQLDHFCDVVLGAAAPLVSGRDALETLRVTQAIAEAARTGRLVELG
ncbi:putative dehydrogenase [Blastococcus colisei]|uniref:Putative dehydrogenase n=1 Tax=Blastococcus colisei TaxID=1564162 RepID=A0A543PDV4_9ACTN|nr:Gfo/Idh/MocA family oxidoreductase [Blastococcus colisei]TQN42240.1 putative dehydrogenase [Blastococcus colisei]